MKKSVTIIILILIAVVFGGSLYYLYNKNQEDPIVYATESPTIETIIKQTVATGSIVPKEEILIKPNISGIIDEIAIEAGDIVKEGDLIAKLKIVPNVTNLASSKNQISTTRIALENQKKIYDRQKALFDKGVISANEFDQANTSYLQAKQSYDAANQTYQIVKTGSARGLGVSANTEIRATVSGMVLDVPVKTGNQVIESNNFNDGTTIATLANVNNMIFEGKVDESEVGKVAEGLPLEITVGAIENKKFDAILDYVAPKGVAENGAIQFAIKGTLKKNDSTFIRAGLSVNASIILAKAENVLAIKEALVQYDDKTKQPYVEVETGDQQFERRNIRVGVSDGINVEVTSGLTKDDKIKVWNQVKPAQDFGGRRG